MAKKPVKNKIERQKESKLKIRIQHYILKEGELKAELNDPSLEFNFYFIHPKEKKPDGTPIGRQFHIVKPKKENYIEFSTRKNIINPKQLKILNSSDERKRTLFNNLIKLFLLKNVNYILEMEDYRYNLINRVYLGKSNYISMNRFYKTLRNLLNTDIYATLLIQEICEGKFEPENITSRPLIHI